MNLLAPDSHLLQLARGGQLRLPERWPAATRRLLDRIAYPGATVLYVLAVPLLSALLVAPIVVVLLIAGQASPDSLTAALSNLNPATATLGLLATGGYIVLAWLWVRALERRGLASLGLERRRIAARYGRGLLVGLLMFGGAVALLGLSGNLVVEANPAVRTGPAALGGVLLLGLGWLVQGAAEEVLDRGLLLPVLGARFGAPAGILISSLVFAVQHLLNPNLSAIALLNLFLFGVFACLYALYEGSLWGVCAVHSVWNLAQGNFFGFEVSGGLLTGATLVDLGEAGPDWLTGGPFGPEGGLAVTAVLLLAMAAVWWAARRADAAAGW